MAGRCQTCGIAGYGNGLCSKCSASSSISNDLRNLNRDLTTNAINTLTKAGEIGPDVPLVESEGHWRERSNHFCVWWGPWCILSFLLILPAGMQMNGSFGDLSLGGRLGIFIPLEIGIYLLIIAIAWRTYITGAVPTYGEQISWGCCCSSITYYERANTGCCFGCLCTDVKQKRGSHCYECPTFVCSLLFPLGLMIYSLYTISQPPVNIH
jgi:hypothetical protein